MESDRSMDIANMPRPPDPEGSSNGTGTTTPAFSACSSSYYSDYNQGDISPCNMSPWHHSAASPYSASPWNQASPTDPTHDPDSLPPTCLIGSLVREEGHIYSLATRDDLLYTGSDSKNIRVWKEQKEFCGFKSSSGLVKSIIVASDRIFSGHQDGKIRVWKLSPKDPTVHKRVGSLPKVKDIVRCSLRPSNYVEGRRKRSGLWIRHYDAISCLSYNQDQGLLYSGSWDKTFKVWRVADSKCLESVVAHDDAVNAVVAPTGFDGVTVFTGSADGTVKVWKREMAGKGMTKHMCGQTLLQQESAVTALVVGAGVEVVYSGSSDGVINLWEWDGRGYEQKEGLKGHKMAVLCLAAAGALVFSGSADKMICVWRRDGAAHVCVSVLSGHGGPVKCLAVEKDKGEEGGGGGGGGGGRYVVYSGSLDKSVKVWRVTDFAPDALLQSPRPSAFGYGE